MVYVSGGWPLVTQREMWRESQEGLVYSLGVSGGLPAGGSKQDF